MVAAIHPQRSGRERLLVVGGGMASVKLAEELVARCPGAYDVAIVAKETHPPYNRVLLSSVLAGDADEEDLTLRAADWYRAHGIGLLCGHGIAAIDAARRIAMLGNGVEIAFDRLVLATGSQALRLPLPGHTLPGVVTFRDLGDVRTLGSVSAGSRAVVIGGGLLGIEAAYGLATRGVEVTLLHLMPRLMERQLDARAAILLKNALERKGIQVVLQAATSAIEGTDKVQRVMLADGRAFAADIVVMAAGIRPETALAQAMGLDIGRAIRVGDTLQTSRPHVYAIGECAEHRGTCYGLVEPAYEQARVLAAHLAGESATYAGSVTAVSLKVSGVPVFSMGDFEGQGADVITLEDEAAATYRKLVVRNGRLAGAVLFGETGDALWYRELIAQGAPLAKFRPQLAFGKAYAEAA